MSVSIIERAMEIASSGSVRNIVTIERKLTREGFENARQHLFGHTIRAQLNAAIKRARGEGR